MRQNTQEIHNNLENVNFWIGKWRRFMCVFFKLNTDKIFNGWASFQLWFSKTKTQQKTNNLSVNKTPQRYLFHFPKDNNNNNIHFLNVFLIIFVVVWKFFFSFLSVVWEIPLRSQHKEKKTNRNNNKENIYSLFQLISSWVVRHFLRGLEMSGNGEK